MTYALFTEIERFVQETQALNFDLVTDNTNEVLVKLYLENGTSAGTDRVYFNKVDKDIYELDYCDANGVRSSATVMSA